MKVRKICHARWEIPLEFVSLRDYFEPFALSTISFSDSVDELDDELDEYEYEEGNLFLFSCLDIDFFCLFLLEHFISSGLMKENLFLFSLTCFVYLPFLLRTSLGFLIPSLLAHHISYLQLYHFLALPFHWS